MNLTKSSRRLNRNLSSTSPKMTRDQALRTVFTRTSQVPSLLSLKSFLSVITIKTWQGLSQLKWLPNKKRIRHASRLLLLRANLICALLWTDNRAVLLYLRCPTTTHHSKIITGLRAPPVIRDPRPASQSPSLLLLLGLLPWLSRSSKMEATNKNGFRSLTN